MSLSKCNTAIVCTIFIAIAICGLTPKSNADIIHESATMGAINQYQGYKIWQYQFLGSRFEITETTEITAIGGHIATEDDDRLIFGAIVSLNSQSDLPPGLPFWTSKSEVVAWAYFNPPWWSFDKRIPLTVILEPGWYGLVFGAGEFGSLNRFAESVMPYIGQTNLSGNSYFHWNGSGWYPTAYSPSSYPRFVVEGHAVIPPVEIYGTKFNDVDGNGVWDAGEPNMPGWDIYLDENGNGIYDASEPNTVTDSGGMYRFENLDTPATYRVREMMKDGWTQTLPGGPDNEYVVVAEPNNVYGPYDFGNTELEPGPKITGHVLLDGGALTGVTVSGEPGGYGDVTDGNGYYEIMVADGWTGSVTASKDRYGFNEVYPFSNLTSDRVADFTAYCVYSGGDGTDMNPFHIADVVDLLALGEDTANYDKYFIQTADISLAGAGEGPGGVFASAVIARSTATSYFNGVVFEGVYDGNGFAVSDLSIDATTSGYNYLGLFGKVRDGLIKNLRLENISIDGEYIVYVGGVAGYNDGGTIYNCNSSVSIEGGISGSHFGGITGYNDDRGTIEKCSASGSISGSIGTVGGLAGRNELYSVIIDSNSSCSITANINLGGLVGVNSVGSEILDSYATGNVSGSSFYYNAGGLVGDNYDGLISGCHATGTVSGNREVGGLAGRNFFDGTIVNCYATGRVDGVWNVGGLVGINKDIYQGIISHCYAAGDVSGSTAVGGLCGYNPDNHLADPIPIIVDCFWDTSVQTHGVSVGIGINNELVSNVLGKTTSQMEMQSTFTDYGWDFAQEAVNGTEDIWHMPFGTVGYPKLRWQRDIPGDWVGKYGVGVEDYAVLAGSWMNINAEVNLSGSDIIDFEDLRVFFENWLAGR